MIFQFCYFNTFCLRCHSLPQGPRTGDWPRYGTTGVRPWTVWIVKNLGFNCYNLETFSRMKNCTSCFFEKNENGAFCTTFYSAVEQGMLCLQCTPKVCHGEWSALSMCTEKICYVRNWRLRRSVSFPRVAHTLAVRNRVIRLYFVTVLAYKASH